MTSLKELQKALDKFPKPYDNWTTRAYEKPYEDWVKDFSEKFAEFQRQLEDERKCSEIKMGAMLKALEEKHRELEAERKLPLDLKKHAKTGCCISGGVCWDGGTSSDAEERENAINVTRLLGGFLFRFWKAKWLLTKNNSHVAKGRRRRQPK